MILRSLNVSSVLGDVLILLCTVSRLKSKRFLGKVNSNVFVDFQPSRLTHARLFNRHQTFLDYSRASRGNGRATEALGTRLEDPDTFDMNPDKCGQEISTTSENTCNINP